MRGRTGPKPSLLHMMCSQNTSCAAGEAGPEGHTIIRWSQVHWFISELLVKVFHTHVRLDNRDKGRGDLEVIEVIPVKALKEWVTFHLLSITFPSTKSAQHRPPHSTSTGYCFNTSTTWHASHDPLHVM